MFLGVQLFEAFLGRVYKQNCRDPVHQQVSHSDNDAEHTGSNPASNLLQLKLFRRQALTHMMLWV